jgi:predicted nucleic acid-binding protein
MKYLIDSDWIIEFLKGRTEAVRLINLLLPLQCAISIMTYGEVYQGIYYGRDRAQNEKAFRRFLRGVTVLGVSRVVARQYAIVRGDLQARGMLIAQPDILIAATAIHHGLELVTRNVRDFGRIPGLVLYRP